MHSNLPIFRSFRLPVFLVFLLFPVFLQAASLVLTWTDNSDDETGFRIERAATTDGPFVAIATVGANVTTYTDDGLAEKTAYAYQVRAFNAYGDSDPSNVATATTGGVPSAPSGLSVSKLALAAVGLLALLALFLRRSPAAPPPTE